MNNTAITIIGFLIIFFATSLGAALVFFLKNNISEKFNAIILGLSSGVMVAASIWSLLLPAIEETKSNAFYSFLPVSIGFLMGGFFIFILDKFVNLINKNKQDNLIIKKPFKMFLAITIHNIPEGLAVGFAFGGAALIGSYEAYLAAMGLAMGIAIQNLPEGAAVSLPLKKETNSNIKAFLFGIFSGIVEPIAAIVGYYLSSTLIMFQPWFLSFAAGAMIFVVVEDLIPDSKLEKSPNLGAWGFMLGFVVMMTLDVVLG